MPRRHLVYILGSVLLLAGAVFTVLPAGAWKWLACENDGSEACGRKALADVQFVVACVGIAPAALLVWDTARRSVARSCGSVWGLGSTSAGAVLLDAAIHGWDDLALLPSASG